mgnify:CR=1 FL=1
MPTAAIPEAPHSRADVALRRVGSEWVLYDPARDKAHVLNATAAVVWAYCDGAHEAGAIGEAIASDLPSADAEQVRRDVEAVLRRFAAEGLLR